MTCPPDAFRSGRDLIVLEPGQTWSRLLGHQALSMEFDEVVRRRRMVRAYDPDRPVPAEIRDKLIEHALRAPSAGFSQGWGFLVLEETADLERYWSATASGEEPDGWLERMRTAPLIIVPMSNKSVYLDRYAQADKGWTDRDESRWPVPYWDIDTGFAALLIHLTAVDQGLGVLFLRTSGRSGAALQGGVRRSGGVHADRRAHRGLRCSRQEVTVIAPGAPARGRSGASWPVDRVRPAGRTGGSVPS